MLHWLQNLIIFVLLVAISNLILRKVFNSLTAKKKLRHSPRIKQFLDALNRPLRVYLWILIGFDILHFVLYSVLKVHFEYFNKLLSITTLVAIIWISLRLVHNIEQHYIQKLTFKKNVSFEKSSIRALSRLGQLGIFALSALILLSLFKIPLSGLLTFGGVSGIAVAYAGKSIISSFFGGLIVYFNRQFSVGDWVRSPDRDIEGEVEKIGWSHTTIRRFDKQLVYVPNSIFADIILVNPSRMTHRLIHQIVGVRYDDIQKIPKILEGIHTMVRAHPHIAHISGEKINITEFASSSVNLQIYIYSMHTETREYLKLQDEVMLKVAEIINACGAECAFPTTTVYLQSTENT